MLGIYTQYSNGELYMDATPYMYNLEYTTNEYGFWYLSCNLRINKQTAADLYKNRKVFHIYYGDGRNTFFEGRLEDVEYSKEPKIVAYGYIRAFTDIQVTDLWSTERLDLWKPLVPGMRDQADFRTDFFTVDTSKNIYIALNKNTEPGNAAVALTRALGGFKFEIPRKGSRPINTASFQAHVKDQAGALIFAGLQRIETDTYTSSNPDPNPWQYSGTASGYAANIVVNPYPTSGLALYLNYVSTSLYIGETGDISLSVPIMRVGTTPSVSGARLYADEILKYTISGIFALNPTQINPTYIGIQSPQKDLKEVIFEDMTGLDVANFLLDYPDSNGNFYELKVWEDQQVLFRPARQTYNTWYIEISDLVLVRTLESTYNSYRGVYTNKMIYKGPRKYLGARYWTQNINGKVWSRGEFFYETPTIEDDVVDRTEFYTNTKAVREYGITRQQNVKFNTEDSTTAATKVQALVNTRDSMQIRTDIEVSYVLNEQGSRFDPRFVRSGDKIIIQNIPAALLDEIESVFFVTETKWNATNKTMILTPEEPIDKFETIVG